MLVSDDLRRRMHQEHRTLRLLQEDLLDRFEAFCGDKTPEGQKVLVDVFRDFADSVRRHMDFEEVGGYMNSVVERRPHHKPEVERLRGEHAQIADVLRKLDDDLAADLVSDRAHQEAFRNDFVELMKVFGRHEQAERELVMEVFWLEGGVSE